MAKASHILGMNARNRYYGALNKGKAKRRSNSKLLSKKILEKNNVAVPTLYATISNLDDLKQFSFEDIDTSFVIKPTGGSGGKGILSVRKQTGDGSGWISWDGEPLSRQDLELHIGDILEGQYSTFGTNHKAFIEERVPQHPTFKKYVYKGTPDLRVLVFNSVPVMAMLRLPTKESEGRANLHMGGIGVGIDIATGITLRGVYKRKIITYLPGTKLKLNGIKIPDWDNVLKTAVESCQVIGLKYGGIDLLLHPEKGPMVIELNAAPGLDIQLANDSGLRFRLDKVEGLQIRNIDHGVRVGKALFAEAFADKVKSEQGLSVIQIYETVQVEDAKEKRKNILAMVDTRAFRSKIDRQLAKDLGLLSKENLLWKKTVGRNINEVVNVTFYLKNRKVDSAMTVVNREGYKTKLLLGRVDLQGFLVNPEIDEGEDL